MSNEKKALNDFDDILFSDISNWKTLYFIQFYSCNVLYGYLYLLFFYLVLSFIIILSEYS